MPELAIATAGNFEPRTRKLEPGTLNFAKLTDATLFALRQDFTPLDMLKNLDQLYNETKFKNLNLIFNGIKPGGKYGYRYGYGYGYGYGYYSDKNGNGKK